MAHKIELKNIKHSDFASQETHCYEASLYIDGIKVGKVFNDGHGGPDGFYPDSVKGRTLYEAAEAWLATQPVEGYDFTSSMEIACGDIVNEWLVVKDVKRVLRTKVVFTDPSLDGLRQMSWKGCRKITPAHIRIARERYPNATILNELPVAEAVKLWA